MTLRDQSRLQIVPVDLATANAFVTMWHRHHDPVVGHKFSLGIAADDARDYDVSMLVGVAIVGRPRPRAYQDGRTLEVLRTCTDGSRNANSMLYGAAWRASKALGFRRLITYTQEGESGTSLHAAGWRVVAQRPAQKGWDMPSRPRDDRSYESIPRALWETS